MVAQIIDGKHISKILQNDIAEKINFLKKQYDKVPALAVILIGDDFASQKYVKAKQRGCDYVGIKSFVHCLPNSTQEDELMYLIKNLNDNPEVNGILIQLPLPEHMDKNKLLEMIDPKKDVDGFHPYNLGRLCQRRPMFRPCTPKGIMHLFKFIKVSLRHKDAIVVGASEIVGRPMALELLMAGCTVHIAHRFTQNLSDKLKNADIVIIAVGKPELIKGDSIKSGAVVIDVGINRLENGNLVGDVEFSSVSKKASWITPVPGGVGPMTVSCLLENTLEAFIMQNNFM